MRAKIFMIFFGVGLASAGGLYTVSTMLDADSRRTAAVDTEQQNILRSLVERPFARWSRGGNESSADDKAQSPGDLAQTASLSIEDELEAFEEIVPNLPDSAAQEAGQVELDIVRVEPSGETVIAGRAAPDSQIVILSNGVVIARGEVNSVGEFAIVLAEPLAPGVHDIRVENSLTPASRGVAARAPAFLSVAIPEGDEQEVLVLLDRPGQLSRIIQKPESLAPTAQPATEDQKSKTAALEGWSLPEPGERPRARVETVPTMAIEAVETEGDSLYVAGTARPGARLRIYLDDAYIGTVTTQSTGHWILETKSRIEQGEHRIRADRVAGPGGEVLSRAEVPLVRRLEGTVLATAGSQMPANAAALAVSKRVIIRKGDNLWTISRRTYGSGFRYTTIFKANSDQIVDPDLIFPGQVFQLPLRDREWEDRTASRPAQ